MSDPIASSSDDALLSGLIARSLRCEWNAGAVTPIADPHDTGWRALPGLVIAQIRGCRSVLELVGRQPIALDDGDAISVRPNVAHRFRVRAGGRGESRWSHLRVDLFGSIDVLALVGAPLVLRGALARAAGDANAALAALKGRHGLGPAVGRAALAMAALAPMLANLTAPDGSARLLRALERLAPALQSITEGLADAELTPEHLARRVRLSTSRFNAVFRAALGTSPALYLRRQRLMRAQQLLIGSELRVHAIAERCGWRDPFHFSRLFKQYLGVAPQAYRERALRAGW